VTVVTVVYHSIVPLHCTIVLMCLCVDVGDCVDALMCWCVDDCVDVFVDHCVDVLVC
jgi:hypothetical protein